MDEGGIAELVGVRIGSAPVLGGLRRKKDTGRRAHLHADGLAVEGTGGIVVLPHATTRVCTTDPPGLPPHEDPDPKVQWAFERQDGARWDSGSVDRTSPLARLLAAAGEASAAVRLPLARARLAAGEQVDFAAVAMTAHDLLVPGRRPRPWAEVTGVEAGPEEPVTLSLANGEDLVFSPLRSIADAAVLVALVGERFSTIAPPGS